MEEETMKLTKDMFEAGDNFRRLKNQQYSKIKNKNKTPSKQNTQYKILQNDEESKIKRENMPLLDEQNNSVIIWSIEDNIFPKVITLRFMNNIKCISYLLFTPTYMKSILFNIVNKLYFFS